MTDGAAEKIRFSCPCGARLSAVPALAGRSIDCPACGRGVPVPPRSTREEAAGPPRPAAPRGPARPRARPETRPDGWRRWGRWSLVAALIPLGVYTVGAREGTVERLRRTLDRHPEVAERAGIEEDIDQSSLASVERALQLLPGKKIEGAFVSRSTLLHWIAAAIAACLFWEFILIVQPMGNATSWQLWKVGLFTGTVGIFVLLLIQEAAFRMPAERSLRGPGSVVFIILRLIGWSYVAALDPDSGFLLSLVGFTLGVGILEEVVKAVPLYWHFRRTGTLDARGAVVWGLATGIGFGVSEGVSYSSDFYNGLEPPGIYVVRFISCVGLHAVWSATSAVFLWRLRDSIRDSAAWYGWIPAAALSLGPSVALHGLYDTLLKKEMSAMALGCAFASFALFFWLYDRAVRREPRLSAA